MALNINRSQQGATGLYIDITDENGSPGRGILPAVSIGGDSYSLLSNAAVTGTAVTGVVGGSYIWSVAGTFGGATVKLQALGPDGSTYLDVPSASMTAVGQLGVAIGANATLKVVVTGGTPSALYSSLT